MYSEQLAFGAPELQLDKHINVATYMAAIVSLGTVQVQDVRRPATAFEATFAAPTEPTPAETLTPIAHNVFQLPPAAYAGSITSRTMAYAA